jgi:hypothetical protein
MTSVIIGVVNEIKYVHIIINFTNFRLGSLPYFIILIGKTVKCSLVEAIFGLKAMTTKP